MEQHPDSPAVATAPTAARPAALSGTCAADLNPLPAPENGLVPQARAMPPAVDPDEPDEPDEPDDAPEARSFDPAAYKWVPVLRKPRKDGWTPQRQVAFIAALADTGCVQLAAFKAGMTANSCYRLRRAPGAEDFAHAWDVAIAHSARRLVDVAFDRAFNGSDEPVFDKEGRRIGRRMRQNDRLLMFLLRAYMPERFRHAHRDMREADEPLPLPAEPVGDALDRLEPAPPAAPHLLMAPGELETELQVADILGGTLPHWYRGQGDAEPVAEDPPDPEFERALEAAKNGDWSPGEEASEAEKPAGQDPFLA